MKNLQAFFPSLKLKKKPVKTQPACESECYIL
jgi:hypothetical protein